MGMFSDSPRIPLQGKTPRDVARRLSLLAGVLRSNLNLTAKGYSRNDTTSGNGRIGVEYLAFGVFVCLPLESAGGKRIRHA